MTAGPLAFGDWVVTGEIARGGMGAVLEARHARTGAPAAIKVVLRAGDEGARARFRREAELMARAGAHPGIVKVHSLGELPDGTLYVVLERVQGEGLDRLLARGPLDVGRAAGIARDVARALGHVHALGIVHRDVKPSNVLLDAAQGGAPRLVDFGIATARDVERLTRSGQFVGTLRYCSPEQVRAGPASPASDVFAVGSVLFEMLSGVGPVEEETVTALIAELARDAALRDVRTVAPAVPADLAAVVAHALEKDARARYPDGAALAHDLDLFLAGKPVQAPRPRRAPRSTRLGLAALVLAGAGLGVLWLRASERDHAARVEAALRARQALHAVRDLLGRPRPEATDPAASGTASDSGRPRADLGEARARLDEARRQLASLVGPDAAPELEAEARTYERALAVAEAQALVAAGQGDEAAAKLATVARGSALAPAERLLLARALLASGHAADAERTARELEASSAASPSERADAAELAGDVALARSDAAGARARFEHALALGSRRTREIKTKRVGAIALGGDAEGALRELEALGLDPAKLSPERAANALLAPLAPALYRRAVDAAAKNGDSARDLECAWRLADPPDDLRARVAARLIACSAIDAVEFVRFRGGTAATELSSADVETLGTLVRFWRRARSLEPGIDDTAAWTSLMVIRGWIGSVLSQEKTARFAELRDRIVAEWPDHPVALMLLAHSCLMDDPRAAHELARRGIAALPPRREDESLEVPQLGGMLFALELGCSALLPPGSVDADALEPLRARLEAANVGAPSDIAVIRANARRQPDPFRIPCATMKALRVPPCAGFDINGTAPRGLEWRLVDPRAGDELALAFTVPVSGTYDVSVTAATDPTIKAVATLGGAEPRSAATTTGTVVIREVPLREGTSELAIRVVSTASVAGDHNVHVAELELRPPAGSRGR